MAYQWGDSFRCTTEQFFVLLILEQRKISFTVRRCSVVVDMSDWHLQCSNFVHNVKCGGYASLVFTVFFELCTQCKMWWRSLTGITVVKICEQSNMLWIWLTGQYLQCSNFVQNVKCGRHASVVITAVFRALYTLWNVVEKPDWFLQCSKSVTKVTCCGYD